MALDVAEIERALRVDLPPEWRNQAALLALQLAEFVTQPRSTKPGFAHVAVEPASRSLLEFLAGRQIQPTTNGPLISFGQDNHFGSVTIGDVAGGDLVKIYITLNSRPPTSVPFLAPALPPHFVPRPDVSSMLIQNVLSESNPVNGVLHITAIHALGGSGKSVIAQSLAHNLAVQTRFPDGTLWVTLTQQPDLLAMLRDWIWELGDTNFHPTSIGAASRHLNTLLRDKTCLLVLDDAWDANHVRPFLVGGTQCRVLLTTRRAHVADELGATLYELKSMAPEEALELLAKRLGHSIVEQEQAQARLVAQAVGHLPLALELAAARVGRGVFWNALHEALEAEVARIEELEDPRRRLTGQPQLEATLRLSLRALQVENEEAWRALIWLAVLPEDASIAAPLAATLWQKKEAQADLVLEVLWSDALLLRAEPLHIGERIWSSYRLHDLIHDTARRLLVAPETPSHNDNVAGLGLSLQSAQAALLQRYKERIQGGLWHTLPADGYIHTHLVWHMAQAGSAGAIHTLLEEETNAGTNGWYEALEQLGLANSYASDVSHAWRLLNDDIWADKMSTAEIAGLQVRYALMLSSLRSQATNLPASLIYALVKSTIWTPKNALAAIRQIVDEEARSEALIKVLPLLRPDMQEVWQQEALDTIRKVAVGDKAKLLHLLIEELPNTASAWVLRAVLHEVTVQHAYHACRLLISLAPRLPETLLDEAEGIADAIKEPEWRIVALAALAQRRSLQHQDQVRSQVELLAYTTHQLWERVAALEALTILGYRPSYDNLLQSVTASVLAEASLLELPAWRAHSCIRLVPLLPGEKQRQALTELVDATNYHGLRKYRTWTSTLAMLTSEIQQEVVEAFHRTGDRYTRALVLADLLPVLDGAVAQIVAQKLVQLVDAIRGNLQPWDSFSGEKLLEELSLAAPGMPLEVITQLLERTATIHDLKCKAITLARLGAALPENSRTAVVQQALEAARAMLSDESQSGVYWAENISKVVGSVAAYLPPSLLRQALELAQAIRDDNNQISGLAHLVPYLPEREQEDAFRWVLTFFRGMSDKERVETIASMAPNLSQSMLVEVQDVIRSIKPLRYQIEALTALVPRLPEAQQAKLRAEAFQKAQNIENIGDRASALALIVALLPSEQQEQTLAECSALLHKIDRPFQQAEVLVRLVPHLSELECNEQFDLVIDAAKWGEKHPEDTFNLLIPHMSLPILRKFYERTVLYERNKWIDEVPKRMLKLGAVTEAFRLALTLEEWPRFTALDAMVEDVPTDLIEDALSAALTFAKQDGRGGVLAKLCGPLAVVKGRATAIAYAEQLRESDTRAYAFASIALASEQHQKAEVLAKALRAYISIPVRSGLRYKPLRKLAHALSTCPPSVCRTFWNNLLQHLATCERMMATPELYELAPVTTALGGQVAAGTVYRSIRRVIQWWP